MNIMSKITISSFKKNKKRTIVTIIGIMLATALITTVATIGESFRLSMVAYERKNTGDYHDMFQGVPKDYVKYFMNNKNMEQVNWCASVGYGILEKCENPDKPYMYIHAISPNANNAMALQLLQGRMPKTEDEIVISEHLLYNGGLEYALGDEITVQVGKRISEVGTLGQTDPFHEDEKFVSQFTKSYKIVGIISRPNYSMEPYSAPGYSAFTIGNDYNAYEKFTLYVRYKSSAIKDRYKIIGKIVGVSEKDLKAFWGIGSVLNDTEWERVAQKVTKVMEDYESHRRLITFETMDFQGSVYGVIVYMMALALVIIVITSVFCIRNSFMISMMEKMRLYGMITSIGATKKQRKSMVYTEAKILSILGVPLGILLGLLASFITVKGISGMLLRSLGIELVFGVSVWALLLSVVVSVITVFLSAGKAARVTAKLSPIDSIKGNVNQDLFFGKKKQKKINTPFWVNKCFGIGGKLAYKNLKRSKLKYRTTVISIVVSVAVFIGLTTFTSEIEYLTKQYYREEGYDLSLSHSYSYEETCKEVAYIESLPEISYMEVERYIIDNIVKASDIQYTQEYLEDFEYKHSEMYDSSIEIFSIGQEAFEDYCKKIGIEPWEMEDQAILVNDYGAYIWDGEKSKYVTGNVFDIKVGDVIPITGYIYPQYKYEEEEASYEESELEEEIDEYSDEDIWQDEEFRKENQVEDWNLRIVAVTDVRPVTLLHYGGEVLVVSDAWMDAHQKYAIEHNQIYIRCKDAYLVEKKIEEYLRGNGKRSDDFYISNIQEDAQQIRSLYLSIEILLYGFIIVIALIGITNVINTVTTNMELRAREFAMLRSVGMTGGEFKRMIFLENLFYGSKALLFAIPIGLLFSRGFYYILNNSIEVRYQFPIKGVITSIIAVILLLGMIMHSVLKKNTKKNIIETITNENI